MTRRAALVLPHAPDDHPERAETDALTTLIRRELPELETEIGCPVEPCPPERLSPHEPAVLIGPAAMNPALQAWQKAVGAGSLPAGPFVIIDRERLHVVVDAPDLAGIGDAMQLVRTAIAEGKKVIEPSVCHSVYDVIHRIDTEVWRTFPLAGERAPGWRDAVAHARVDMDGADDLPTLQRLMATLGDAHSWARDPRVNGRLPYHLHDDGTTTRLSDVPSGSAAWTHGLRPGDALVQPATGPWWPRTGSAARTRPWNVGYRALQGRVGEHRELAGIRGDGSEVRWSEPIPPMPWASPIEMDRIDARTGYLRIRGWLNGADWRDHFETALAELASYERLVVDLRGNVGGALVAAQDARARFLPGPTTLGTIRFSTVTGALGQPHELVSEPPASGPLWTKPVRFLVDPLSYSATEDFLQGLQGLPHVQLVGQRTGGGSGRPRTVRLRKHVAATISTALTYDRTGRCLEGNGWAPDIAVPFDPAQPGASLMVALATW
jgi:carboxyl-terminal processing protease